MSVAPVWITLTGFTPGAEVRNVVMILFANADCAAARLKEPPRFWKTGSMVSLAARAKS